MDLCNYNEMLVTETTSQTGAHYNSSFNPYWRLGDFSATYQLRVQKKWGGRNKQ